MEGFPNGRPEWMRRGLTREIGVSVMNDVGGLKGQCGWSYGSHGRLYR